MSLKGGAGLVSVSQARPRRGSAQVFEWRDKMKAHPELEDSDPE